MEGSIAFELTYRSPGWCSSEVDFFHSRGVDEIESKRPHMIKHRIVVRTQVWPDETSETRIVHSPFLFHPDMAVGNRWGFSSMKKRVKLSSAFPPFFEIQHLPLHFSQFTVRVHSQSKFSRRSPNAVYCKECSVCGCCVIGLISSLSLDYPGVCLSNGREDRQDHRQRFTGFQWLCEEFDFEDFAAKLSEFRPSMGFKETDDANTLPMARCHVTYPCWSI